MINYENNLKESINILVLLQIIKCATDDLLIYQSTLFSQMTILVVYIITLLNKKVNKLKKLKGGNFSGEKN